MINTTTIKIPKKYEHMIDEIYKDDDGYWVHIKEGFYSPEMDCHTIHEYTQKEVLALVRNIVEEPTDNEPQQAAQQTNDNQEGDNMTTLTEKEMDLLNRLTEAFEAAGLIEEYDEETGDCGYSSITLEEVSQDVKSDRVILGNLFKKGYFADYGYKIDGQSIIYLTQKAYEHMTNGNEPQQAAQCQDENEYKISIVERESGEVVQEFTTTNEREFTKIQDALIFKVDFSRYAQEVSTPKTRQEEREAAQEVSQEVDNQEDNQDNEAGFMFIEVDNEENNGGNIYVDGIDNENFVGRFERTNKNEPYVAQGEGFYFKHKNKHSLLSIVGDHFNVQAVDFITREERKEMKEIKSLFEVKEPGERQENARIIK